ncbi:MAG: TolC family protein [Verrucomicrobiae bacterium]|nr:TolC family protein [Verrucomicrobiae bacterium]NNJ43029.1 TolC family protein [Akkermansiaceae bacterium]
MAAAFAHNPDLAVIAARLARADAQVASARASSIPTINLGLGHRDGRKREADFGPYALAPWESRGQFSWEIDLSGRLRATTRSARHARDAAFWDVHAARLQLASRIAATRFNLYRFNTEIALLKQSTGASQETLQALRARANAGIIATSTYHRQQAEHEKFTRQLVGVNRLRDITVVQLRTLVGGTMVSGTTRRQLPSPRDPSPLPLPQLLKASPTLLAAEARVRSAFQLEKSAKLDLLPSLRFKVSATGAASSLTRPYQVWQHQVGPSLDIPIYDPTRLAKIKLRRAETQSAAAQYRSAVLTVLGEVDQARISMQSRREQLRIVQRELASMQETRRYAAAQLKAGVTSQIEYLDTERRWLDAKRSEAAIQQALLIDHLHLIKALGGAS